MTTENATATITRETRIIPIIYDSPADSIPVAAPKISLALKACPKGALSLGFKFARSVRVSVTPEGGGKKISFSREKETSRNYLFAESLVSRAEFDSDPQYKTSEIAYFRQTNAWKLTDPESIIYTSSLGLGILDRHARAHTVLITRQGERLYPAPGAKTGAKAPALR